jgi:hypothetical protein
MALSHSPRIVTDGLVLRLDAANPKSYSGSGVDVFDLSLGKRTSTLVNSPSYSNGEFIFDGTSRYISSPRIPDTGTSTASLTWSLWCSPSITGDGDIINMQNGSGWNMCPFYSTGQKFYARVWSSPAIVALSTYTVNQYYYLTLVYNHSITDKIKFYINGQLQGSSTSSYSASGTVDGNFLYFGRAGNQATNTNFNGKISECLIYNKALSDVEVQQNFNALRGRYGL